MLSRLFLFRCWCIALFVICLPSHAEKSTPDAAIDFAGESQQQSSAEALGTVKKLSQEIQALKGRVVTLNKDLRLMEEELLFPSSTQCSVFVSLDIGEFFKLESIKLKIDGKLVATHLYSVKQREALARGGVQRLHLTNLNEGLHSVSAFFTGIGPNGRPYKRAASLEFTKGKGSQYLELTIVDDLAKQEPIFRIKQW